MSAFRKILTSLLLGAGLSVLFPSCVQTSHVDLDSLRHSSSSKEKDGQGAGRRTWEGDETPGFAFGTNGVYYCVYHGDGSHGPHYAYDLELLKGEAGMYRLFWWLDGEQVQQDLTLADGTAVHQGDSVSLKTGELCRLNLPEMAAGDAQEHTFTLGVSWKGFEKTLAVKFYQGYPVLSVDDIHQEQNARRTSYRVVSAEDLGEGTLTVYVDGRKAQNIWTGPSLSASNPLALTLTRDDQPRLLLDQYSKGTHELTVRFDSSDGSRTETAVARWTEPQWQADPDPEPEPEPDPEPEPEPDEPDEPLAPYKFVFDCQYDYNRDKYVAQLVLTEGDDADYSISVDFEDVHYNLTSAATVWDYGTLEEIDLSEPVHMEKNRPLRLVLPDFDPGTYPDQTARPGTYNVYVTLAAGGFEVTQKRAYFTDHRSLFDVSVDTEAASGLTEFSFELNYWVQTQLHMQFYYDLTDTYGKHDYCSEANAYGGVLWLEAKNETWFSKRGYEYSNGHWLFSFNQVEKHDVFTWKVTRVAPGEHTLVLQIWVGWYDSLIGSSIESPGYKVTYLYRWTEPDRGN